MVSDTARGNRIRETRSQGDTQRCLGLPPLTQSSKVPRYPCLLFFPLNAVNIGKCYFVLVHFQPPEYKKPKKETKKRKVLEDKTSETNEDGPHTHSDIIACNI